MTLNSIAVLLVVLCAPAIGFVIGILLLNRVQSRLTNLKITNVKIDQTMAQLHEALNELREAQASLLRALERNKL